MKIKTFYRNILIGIPIGITVFDTVGYVARVDGVSMQPALNPDYKVTDYIFLNRWAVRSYEIERGDIVSLISPKNPDQKIVKRVIGLQGDIIDTIGYKKKYVCIPEGHCWIEGDHTGNSLDSNTFGPVSLGLITAKASAVVWPPSRWQRLTTYLPQDRVPVNLKIASKMRSVYFVNRLEFDFACGNGVLRDAMAIGDVDNDGRNELIVGNTSGDLFVFKGKNQLQKIVGLGMISCIGIGDILNCGSNAVVVIGGDGWCRIFYCTNTISSKVSENVSDSGTGSYLECVHVQRIPANSKVVLLGDIDGDGLIEMVLALTDRVLRSYRWYNSEPLTPDLVEMSPKRKRNFKTGKLVCLNKWESSNQIGAITLQCNPNGQPALLVAQPGGTFMRIRCNTENNTSELYSDNTSVHSENLTAPGVDYQFLGISRMRNQNVSTEVLADLNIKENVTNESQKLKPYAVATLDGTIMLVREENILWSIQVDHQIFALEKLDITGNGTEEIVACSWDGSTYMLDQNKNSIRFQLDEPVQAFCCGYYTIDNDKPEGSASLVYVTFKNKIYIYHDLQISNMVSRKLNLDLPFLNDLNSLKGLSEVEQKIQKKRIVEKCLYYHNR